MAFNTSDNKRVLYATQAVALGDMGATGVKDSWGNGDSSTYSASGMMIIMHGIQSIGVNTNFSLDFVKELGQLSTYEAVEEVPDIEVSIERFLDGYTMAYHAATVTAADPTLTGRQNARADLRMVIGLDTDSAVTSGDTLAAELYCSGMYWSSYSIQMPTDGTMSESLKLVGNNKRWLGNGSSQLLLGSASGVVNSAFGTIFGNDSPNSPDSGVMRRNNFLTGSGVVSRGGNKFITLLPDLIQGISNNGSSALDGGSVDGSGSLSRCGTVNTTNCHVQSLSFSVDAGRKSINHLGTLAPYYRYVDFPVTVSTEIEVIATAGDNVDALEDIPSSGNLRNHSIMVCLSDSTVVQLGNKNKLTSVTYGGGDATGGNAVIKYSMQNQNDFAVLHSGDPCALESTAYFKNWFT
jgi:hypothetical protein